MGSFTQSIVVVLIPEDAINYEFPVIVSEGKQQ
jgi:hypothetical protein